MEGYASTPIIFLSTFIVGLIQFIFILRLIFEITQVNFYNPVCQMVVKFTDPVLKPLRVIPLNFGRVDLIIVIILTIFSFLFLVTNKNHSKKYRVYTLITQNILIIGFIFFILFNSNPFDVIIPTPTTNSLLSIRNSKIDKTSPNMTIWIPINLNNCLLIS